MTLVQLVSLQLMLYAPLWLLAAGVFRDERPAVVHWFGYALMAALAMALISSRDDGPNWTNTAFASLSVLLSLVLARRGVELFLHLRPSDREFALLLVIAALGFAVIGTQPERAWLRAMLTSGISAVLLLSALRPSWRALTAEFSVRLGLAAGLPVTAVLFVHLMQMLMAWRDPEAIRVMATDAMLIPARVWVVVLSSAAAFNYLFLFLVALRLGNQLSHQARHDPLTGLLNRRAMQHVLAHEWARYQNQATAFTLLSLDVDHFKRINDQHGHGAGDEVLRGVAQRLQLLLRPVDRLARTGGEEMLILLPGCSAHEVGVQMAERLRTALAQTPLAASPTLDLIVTASWGVASPASGDARIEQVMERADAAMYLAKQQGRNRVVASSSAMA